ncbi:hypothetical protein [Lysobacter sp. CA199]|uniref:hypothetical protein n=1 Tax=Lysobacter sp. CA199 TaxID=3455608 RepID=UPI003F8D666F
MHEYRITKYDPALRDDSGAYLGEAWTSIGDIGRSFDGVVLTEAEYRRVEAAYVDTAVEFLHEAGVAALTVRGLENHRDAPIAFGEGAALPLEQVGDWLRRMLREQFWCRLESDDAFVHVGYDYYLYVGVAGPCPRALRSAAGRGLFVEAFASPYGAITKD